MMCRVRLTASPDLVSAVPDRWSGIERGATLMGMPGNITNAIARFDGVILSLPAKHVEPLDTSDKCGGE